MSSQGHLLNFISASPEGSKKLKFEVNILKGETIENGTSTIPEELSTCLSHKSYAGNEKENENEKWCEIISQNSGEELVSGNAGSESSYELTAHEAFEQDKCDEAITWSYMKYDFLKPENIKDSKMCCPSDPNYDSHSLYVPDYFLSELTPTMKQWWDIKSKNFDSVIFFKIGKFYEFYHMDAVIGVKELNLTFMKGEHAFCGFPEISFTQFTSILVDKGYKVIKADQMETPEVMNARRENHLLFAEEVNFKFSGTPALSLAVLNNNENEILNLINGGANIDEVDQDGWSPIFYAVASSNVYLTSLLKDYGANIYLLDKRDRTLIDIAFESECDEVVELINGSRDIDKWYEHFRRGRKAVGSLNEIIISELPIKNNRFTGFNEEIFNILNAAGLNHLKNEFLDSKFGLGHLLTANESTLKKCGVNYWFERRKLLYTIEKFHHHPWNSSSFDFVSPYNELDFHVATLLATITRQMYLISVSTYFWVELGGLDSNTEAISKKLKTALKSTIQIRNKLKKLKRLFKKIGEAKCTTPSDLILPETKSKSFLIKPILYSFGLSIMFCIWKSLF